MNVNNNSNVDTLYKSLEKFEEYEKIKKDPLDLSGIRKGAKPTFESLKKTFNNLLMKAGDKFCSLINCVAEPLAKRTSVVVKSGNYNEYSKNSIIRARFKSCGVIDKDSKIGLEKFKGFIADLDKNNEKYGSVKSDILGFVNTYAKDNKSDLIDILMQNSNNLKIDNKNNQQNDLKLENFLNLKTDIDDEMKKYNGENKDIIKEAYNQICDKLNLLIGKEKIADKDITKKIIKLLKTVERMKDEDNKYCNRDLNEDPIYKFLNKYINSDKVSETVNAELIKIQESMNKD